MVEITQYALFCSIRVKQGALQTAIIFRVCGGLTYESSVLSLLRKGPIIFFAFVTY